MIAIEPPVERVLLVGAPRKGTRDAAEIEEQLDELARLADTAGAAVVGRVVQVVAAPTPDFYVGRGKVEEIGSRLTDLGATVAIFDEELSPTQGKHLEDALKVRVMDRTELILDIFALRAKSREARMQVELAQLEYLLPRLKRMWAHLSRIRGGIGLRGPGETQLETDRRIIRRKIGALKEKLGHVAEHRARLGDRSRERGALRVALVGYTNAGKSSLLRALTGADAHVEDRLFATLDTASREIGAGDGVLGAGGERAGGTPRRIRFTDTVGFIRKLPHDLVASFRATLEEAQSADVIVHVVDVSHPAWEHQAAVVGEVLEGIVGAEGVWRVVVALNKCDRLTPDELDERARSMELRGWRGTVTSALRGDGLAQLRLLLVGRSAAGAGAGAAEALVRSRVREVC